MSSYTSCSTGVLEKYKINAKATDKRSDFPYSLCIDTGIE